MELTVKKLLELCQEQVKSGNGDKKILITSDDEGNEYHGLYYQFEDDYDKIHEYSEFGLIHDIKDDLENYILLG